MATADWPSKQEIPTPVEYGTLSARLDAIDQKIVDAAEPVAAGVVTVPGTPYTLLLTDAWKRLEFTLGTAVSLVVPTNGAVPFPVGTEITLLQAGAGQVTVSGPGVTINGTPGLKLTDQWSSATLVKRATDTWVLIGRLSA